MSISEEILRIQTDRNTIRTKLVELGLAASAADLDDCAAAVDGIENRGAVSANVTEGATYTIPKGYHNGSGTVSGVAGGGNYSLQSKSVTPTKSQQNVTPDSGYYGLSDVTVGAIPENYQDVTPVTATAADVLATKVIVDGTGKSVAGTMPNNGAVSKTLDTSTTSYTVPKGYHNGSGKVSIVNETKSATPTKEAQDITPTTGKVLSKVTVNPIPDEYQDITGVTAEAADVLPGKVFVAADGSVVEGAMQTHGMIQKIISADESSYTIPQGYHGGKGVVYIRQETRTVTPTKETLEVTPSASCVIGKTIVNPIPDKYQDVGRVTAKAEHVLVSKRIITEDGDVMGTMPNNGAVTQTLDTSTTNYTIPLGYHDGTGTVSVVNEEQSATPTKSEQTLTPSEGKVLSKVTVAAIPDEYQVVTNVDATAADVLDGKTIVAADGTEVEGTMPNNGAVTQSLNTSTTSYTIPKGYHNGSGKVSITTETKSATPTKSAQTITPTSGKVLSSVSVAAIPAAYQDVTAVTATAANVLAGDVFVSSTGAKVTGTMPNNGATSLTIDGMTTTSVSIPAGYTSGGTVSLTGDIETALAAI